MHIIEANAVFLCNEREQSAEGAGVGQVGKEVLVPINAM
jgi:hypothetical protein